MATQENNPLVAWWASTSQIAISSNAAFNPDSPFAVTWNLTRLDNIHCELGFTPTNFSVAVDVLNRNISVIPLHAVAWPFGGENLTFYAKETLNTIALSIGSSM
jgi:hypothetical protein